MIVSVWVGLGLVLAMAETYRRVNAEPVHQWRSIKYLLVSGRKSNRGKQHHRICSRPDLGVP